MRSVAPSTAQAEHTAWPAVAASLTTSLRRCVSGVLLRDQRCVRLVHEGWATSIGAAAGRFVCGSLSRVHSNSLHS